MRLRAFLLSLCAGAALLASCQSSPRTVGAKAEGPSIASAWTMSAVSGLPLPGAGGRARPTGNRASLKVLDWAGFKAAASYSFDDTQPSQIQYWPELKATRVRMTFYAWPAQSAQPHFVETWKEAIASGSEIGNHTYHHYNVSELCAKYPGIKTADAAARELDGCDDYITGVLGQGGVWTMAYPYGDAQWKPFLGGRYLVARTVNRGAIAPLSDADPYLLPTYMVEAGDTKAEFDSALGQSLAGRSWVVLLFHSLLPSPANWYAGVQAADVIASIEDAKAGGQIYLDSVVNVASYWIGQRILQSSEARRSGDEVVWTWQLPQGFPKGKYLRVTIAGGHLSQGGAELPWDEHGFYEVALDDGTLCWDRE